MPSLSISDRDKAYINDILAMSEKLSAMLKGVSGDAYADNEMLRLASERLISIIGEASSRVSAETRNSMPSVPWREMSSTRNRLMHDYARVEDAVVYRIATVSVPEMVDMLRSELAKLS